MIWVVDTCVVIDLVERDSEFGVVSAAACARHEGRGSRCRNRAELTVTLDQINNDAGINDPNHSSSPSRSSFIHSAVERGL